MGFMSTKKTKIVYGFLSTVPDQRIIPAAFPAVIWDGEKIVCPDGEHVSAEDFLELVEDRDATRMEPAAAQEGHCVYVPEGNAPPRYVSMEEAASLFKDFADEQIRCGDLLFSQGDKSGALKHYTNASAASQHPDHYRKMLLCPMPESRRERIERLARVR